MSVLGVGDESLRIVGDDDSVQVRSVDARPINTTLEVAEYYGGGDETAVIAVALAGEAGYPAPNLLLMGLGRVMGIESLPGSKACITGFVSKGLFDHNALMALELLRRRKWLLTVVTPIF